MDNNNSFENIFKKLGDLKDFFVYGQKLIPILHKIQDFMHDTVPLLENVNQSIQDSTSKIPKAAMQINSITNANEVATTEILDIVDAMSLDISNMQTKLESLKSKLGEDEDLNSLLFTIDKINAGVLNITISLQVQDITSQQLSSVNHLIQSIQEKLAALLIEFKEKDIHEAPEVDFQFPRDGSFNADARYEKNNKSQTLADSLVEETLNKTTQSEIDKLFAKS
jgi:chemotaxis regulatin CheY-phosphate phosphatase CheZ